MLRDLIPDVLNVIEYLQTVISLELNNTDLYIIHDNIVHMANLAIFVSSHVNGVAKIHTEILKTQEMREFYDLYPEKFNNKTNGVTHRRWLAYCNPELTKLLNDVCKGNICENINLLNNLKDYVDDVAVQDEFLKIKQKRKFLGEKAGKFLGKKTGRRISIIAAATLAVAGGMVGIAHYNQKDDSYQLAQANDILNDEYDNKIPIILDNGSTSFIDKDEFIIVDDKIKKGKNNVTYISAYNEIMQGQIDSKYLKESKFTISEDLLKEYKWTYKKDTNGNYYFVSLSYSK